MLLGMVLMGSNPVAVSFSFSRQRGLYEDNRRVLGELPAVAAVVFRW